MSGLALHGASKSFPGVRALDGLSFEVAPGEIHVLVGENGAGKSTLLKIIGGACVPDEGTGTLDGLPSPSATHGRARGTRPDWHPGAGNTAWLFVDELEIDPEPKGR